MVRRESCLYSNLVSAMKHSRVFPSILSEEAISDLLGRRLFLCLALIFVLAFLFRLAVVSQLSVAPVYDLLWNDAVAWNLVQGHGFTASQSEPYVPGVFRTPAYPAVLAAVYYLFGHSYQAAFVFQALLDSLSAVLITLIGLRLASTRIALLAGLLYALYPYSAYFCGVLSQDTLLTFTVLVALYLTTRIDLKQPARLQWLLVGLAIGVVALVKSLIILYAAVPALLILVSVRGLRLKAGALALVALGIAAVISPWVVRNYVHFRSFPPLAVGGTGEDWLLTLREMDGGEAAVISGIAPPHDEEESSQYLREFVDGADLIASEKGKFGEAYSEIVKRWPEYVWLTAKHIPRLWITQYTLAHGGLVATATLILSWLYLVPGVVGMFLLRRQWRSLLPLYTSMVLITVIYAPHLAEARYTLPVRPVLMLFVAATLLTIAERFRKPARQSAVVDCGRPANETVSA